MVAPLIPERVLKQIQSLADRSKRSQCWVVFREEIDNGAGGTKLGDPEERGPYKCRLDPSGLQAGEEIRGEQVAPYGAASVALPIDVTPPATTDSVRVVTVLPDGQTVEEVFNVVGDPFYTSYSVELVVPVLKVGV